MDITLERSLIHSNIDTTALQRLTLIILFSVVLHLIIIFGVRFTFIPASDGRFPVIQPIIAIIEEVRIATEPRREISIPPIIITTEPLIIDKEILIPTDNDTEVISNTPDDSVKKESLQWPSRDWLAVSRDYINREAENEFLIEQRNKGLWAATPSILYGPPPDFFGDYKSNIQELQSHINRLIKMAVHGSI